MHLPPNHKYQLRIALKDYLKDNTKILCKSKLEQLDLPGFVRCELLETLIEITFFPPTKISDEFIFKTIETTLRQIGIEFVRGVIRQYVGSIAKTIAGSITGGVLGSRAGPVGLLLGIVAGAVVEKALFDWKDICECSHDNFGNLIIKKINGVKS